MFPTVASVSAPPLGRLGAEGPRTGREETALTLAWATRLERRTVMELAAREGRQTMNLRTMPGSELVVLRRPRGGFAGWAGVDVSSDPERPEVFSQFVYPEFRGLGLGTLLEHLWWAYLASHGCVEGYMRMELDTNQSLVERRLASGYCREVSPEALGPRFVGACGRCELFGRACRRQIYLVVDVAAALAACERVRGAFDVDDLPTCLPIAARAAASDRLAYAA